MKISRSPHTSVFTAFVHFSHLSFRFPRRIRHPKRFAIPFCFLQYTNSLELWSVTTGSPDAERRLLKQKETLDSYTKSLKDGLESLNIRMPETSVGDLNLKQYWNCGVYTTFHYLANFDAKALFSKATSAVNGLFDGPEVGKDEVKPVDKKE